MTRLFSYDFENGTNGATITNNLSGFTATVGTAWTYSNAHPQSPAGGTLTGRCVASAAVSYVKKTLTAAVPALWGRLYLYPESIPAAGAALYQELSGSTVLAEVRLASTGAIQIRNSTFTQVAVSAVGLVPVNTHVRVEHYYSNTTAQQQARVYVGANVNGTTPDWDSGLVTTTAAGTVDGFQFGILNSTTATYNIDNIAVDDAAWVGPVAATSSTVPTADAGASKTGIEPWSTVTLAGADSDTGGTITGRSWVQTGGTTVTLSGASTATATFVAPGTLAGDTLNFSYTVTDSGSVTATDITSVAVLPATERAIVGGVEVPARFRAN